MDILKQLESASISPRESLAGRVVVILKKFILTESIESGERLPAERQMADRLNISRTVLREALNQLIGEGILVRSSPRILCVSEFDRREVAASIDSLDNGDIEFHDLMQLRYILEVGSMPIICEQITSAKIARLEQLAQTYQQELAEGRSGNAADISFHTELLRAVDNSIVRGLLPVIEEQIRSFLLSEPRSLRAVHNSSGNGTRVVYEHEEILDALSKRDADAGLAAMAKHLSPYLAKLRVESARPNEWDNED